VKLQVQDLRSQQFYHVDIFILSSMCHRGIYFLHDASAKRPSFCPPPGPLHWWREEVRTQRDRGRGLLSWWADRKHHQEKHPDKWRDPLKTRTPSAQLEPQLAAPATCREVKPALRLPWCSTLTSSHMLDLAIFVVTCELESKSWVFSLLLLTSTAMWVEK
jgi:hypothetical protein